MESLRKSQTEIKPEIKNSETQVKKFRGKPHQQIDPTNKYSPHLSSRKLLFTTKSITENHKPIKMEMWNPVPIDTTIKHSHVIN